MVEIGDEAVRPGRGAQRREATDDVQRYARGVGQARDGAVHVAERVGQWAAGSERADDDVRACDDRRQVTNEAEQVLFGSPYRADCPTRPLLDRIGDRWTVLVVGVLCDGDARFSELLRRIEGVSQKMLTQTLRGLERDGLVRRTVYPQVPVRVEYALTDAGRTLRGPLLALQEWAIAHMGDVSASQVAYDRGPTS